MPAPTNTPRPAATPDTASPHPIAPALYYRVCCKGLNHKEVGLEEPDIPAYDGLQGLDEGR